MYTCDPGGRARPIRESGEQPSYCRPKNRRRQGERWRGRQRCHPELPPHSSAVWSRHRTGDRTDHFIFTSKLIKVTQQRSGLVKLFILYLFTLRERERERETQDAAAEILHHKQRQQCVFMDLRRNKRVVTFNTTAVIDHSRHSSAGNNRLPSWYTVDFILCSEQNKPLIVPPVCKFGSRDLT